MARLIVGLFVALCLLAAAPARAAEPPSVETSQTETLWKPWKLALVKTVTYRMLGSIDMIIGGYLLTGSEIETAVIVGVVAGAKSVGYYLHELLWAYYGPTADQLGMVDQGLAKSVTYRLTSMSIVFVLSRLFTESIEMSAAVVTVDAIYGMGVYFLHEMLWTRYGPTVPPRPPEKKSLWPDILGAPIQNMN